MKVSKHKTFYDACIIGAGITGLTLAYRLQKAGLRVKLLEKRQQAGGVIRTESIDGIAEMPGTFLFDQGPNSTLTKTWRLKALVDDLGLEQHVCYANDKANNRYILRDEKLRKLPMSPSAFLKSDLLSWRGKLRIFAEPFIPAKSRSFGTSETIADFVRRRLGQEALDYLVNPFIAGVYAGDPEQIDLQTALPRLAALEREHGSLIRGAIAKKRQARDKQISTGPKGQLLSFDTGMMRLVSGFVEHLGECLVSGAEVTAIRSEDDFVDVAFRNAQGDIATLQAHKLILATPADAAGKLLESLHRQVAAALAKIEYVPVAVVFHGYPKSAIRNALDGYGFLVPEKERRQILGTIWSSTIFPQRAPEEFAALTTFVGGARQPDLPRKSETELFEIVESELRELLGIEGQPVVRKIKIWQKAIPQYGRTHADILAHIETFEKTSPQIRIAGNFRKGVSVADCIDYAFEVAEKIIEENNHGRKTQNDQPVDSEAHETAATAAAH